MNAMANISVAAAHSALGAQFLGHIINHLLSNTVSLAFPLCSQLVLNVRLNSDLDVRIVHQVGLVTLGELCKVLKNKEATLFTIEAFPQAIGII